METGITFESVARLTCSRRGWPYETLTTEQFRLVRDEVNDALKWAWESYWWEDTMTVRQVQLRPEYDNTATYAAGAEVYYRFSDGYYVALASTTLNPPAVYAAGVWNTQNGAWARVDEPVTVTEWAEGQTYLLGSRVTWGGDTYQCKEDHESVWALNPTTEPFYWGLVPEFDWVLPYAFTGRPVIGRVRAVTAQNPNQYAAPDPIEFEPVTGGIRLINPTVNRPWVDYRVRCPELDSESWDANTIYTAPSPAWAVWGL